MKKILIPALTICAVMLVTSCTKKNSPESTITTFLNAVNDRNWEEAKKYATVESESMLDMVKGFAEMMPDTTSAVKFEVVKDKTKIEGDAAEVSVMDENKNEMVYKLKKVEDAWKVDFTMEALLGDMSLEDTMTDALEGMENMGDSIIIESDTSMMDGSIMDK
ncbi:MAG: hypothetical protein H7X71_02695 [Chitinophagales bacterium]|nr:hypothetical protein [Chitinophagales bacterium]